MSFLVDSEGYNGCVFLCHEDWLYAVCLCLFIKVFLGKSMLYDNDISWSHFLEIF